MRTTINSRYMKTTTNILTTKLLSAVILLIMMTAGSTNAWADGGTDLEKVIIDTDFQDWDALKASGTGKENVVKKKNVTFHLSEVSVEPQGVDNNNKFKYPPCTIGFLKSAGNQTTYILTDPIPSVSHVKYIHAATGNNRGWKLSVKGDGDTDWVVISDAYASPATGTTIDKDITKDGQSRKNVQLKFENLSTNKNAFMTSLKITDVIHRDFNNCKINFRDENFTTYVPDGITIDNGSYHDAQHGIQDGKLTVNVDGPVKFTIGSCQYNSKSATVSINGGMPINIDIKTPGCDNKESDTHNVTYIYNEEEAATLTFTLGNYCPYFYAEACLPIEKVNITYYDPDGNQIFQEQAQGNTELKFNEGAKDGLTIGSDEAFRGWFSNKSATATKVEEGIILTTDIDLYAKITKIEKAVLGNDYIYDLTKNYWYQEDHELITISKEGAYENTGHGWKFSANATITLGVAESATIELGLCSQTNNNGNIIVKDANGNEVANFPARSATDGSIASFQYKGGTATTLTFSIPQDTYIHSIGLRNYFPVYVTFQKGNEDIEGSMPAKTMCDPIAHTSTMPSNALFYLDGFTFRGWTDGTTVYEEGKTYTFDADVTLTPKMQRNSIDITETDEPIEVRWRFDHRYAPAINMNNKEPMTMLYTETASVSGEPYDLKLLLDTHSGKITNTDERINSLGNDAEGAQMNNGTILKIPAIYGMTITVNASDKVDNENNNTQTNFGTGNDDAEVTIKDEYGVSLSSGTDAIETKTKSVTFKYEGDATTVDILINKAGCNGKAWGFFKDITVTYPVLPYATSENVIESTVQYDLPNEDPKNAGTVEITSTATHSNTGKRFKAGDKVKITGKADYGYKITGFRLKGSDTPLEATKETDANGVETLTAQYTMTTDIATIEAVYDYLPLYKLTLKSSDLSSGTVSLSPIYTNFYNEKKAADGKVAEIENWATEGSVFTASAEIESECVVDYWEEDGTKLDTHANSYAITIGTKKKSLVVHLKPGETGSVYFDMSGVIVNGETADYNNAMSIKPTPITNVRSFTIPSNYTFFKNVDDDNKATENGYTLVYWIDKSDNDNQYELGKTYSFRNKTLYLTPVFKFNEQTQQNRTKDAVIRYDFAPKVHDYYDTDRGYTRKVCGQIVNIGNNQRPFWTSKTYVTVQNNGIVSSHERDVAMWCDTGKNGYIRNTDLENWCAFGPGTTFWFASAAGTKFYILTYSPITTTTVDGIVPDLDEERTQEERKRTGLETVYVYSHTIDNTDDRVPLVIGDDYTFYKWIELHTPKANKVTLTASMDVKSHGILDTENTRPTNDEHEYDKLGGGQFSFNKGERVKVTFNRMRGYELDRIVLLDSNDDRSEPLTLLKMIDKNTVGIVTSHDYSDLKEVTRNADGTWGDSETLMRLAMSDPAAGYTTGDSVRTTYTVDFNITANRNIAVYFKTKDTYYITYNPGEFATGTSPSAEWVEEGDKYTIPENRTLYYEGNTLKYWIDEAESTQSSTMYIIGNEYKAPAQNLRMFPVFQVNAFNILDVEAATVVKWEFRQGEGAPAINHEGTDGLLVSQLKKGSEWIDMKMDINGSKGKCNNVNDASRMQVNAGSILGFPSTPGCVVNLFALNSDVQGEIIAGKKKGDEGFTVNGNSIEATCSGDSTVQTVNFKSGTYCTYMTVTYQKQDSSLKPTLETLTVDGTTIDAAEIERQMGAYKCITFTVSPWKNKNEEMPDITGTATNGGHITATKATVLTKEAVVTVRNKANAIVESYPVEFKFATPEDSPKFVKIIVNGTAYTDTSNELYDVARSGMIKIVFDRTMQEATINSPGESKAYNAAVGKELEFAYWNLDRGTTLTYRITPKDEVFRDIYGMVCQETLELTLHITDETGMNHHHNFDFIVGKDGTMDDAITAANSHNKGDHRFYIFVPDGEYELTGNEPDENTGKNNARTKIDHSNVSLIGQSKDGVVIYNMPTEGGIRAASTIHIDKNVRDFYVQDLTLENRFDYWHSSSANTQAAAFHDQGSRSIMKNVSLKSWQDTYFSNNANEDFRGYFETCDFYGVVDFLCGDGNIWLEKCNILLRNRSGNNIAAPSQGAAQKWGYVFNNCSIDREKGAAQVVDRGWTLARPWKDSPACTFLNTTLHVLPTNVGWNKMEENLKLRFHEHNSMDANGTVLTLGTRSVAVCAPAPGSDDCVMNSDDAAQYTLHNVMQGDDGFEPDQLCTQIDAVSSAEADRDENNILWDDDLEVNDDLLQWNTEQHALCYFVFKRDEEGKWKYVTNTTEASVNLYEYGSGIYCVRAANQRGGLGAATKSIEYNVTDPYELTIKPLNEGDDYGWSTICLPFNAKVPEEVTAYAATAHDEITADEKVDDYVMTLSAVNVIDSLNGYLVYGPVGKHSFKPTSRNCDKPTILTGNPTNLPLSTVNKDGYVLANKSWGLGFYKFSGATYAPYRAWLPQDMVKTNVQITLASGTTGIRFNIVDDPTHVRPTLYDGSPSDSIPLYDLSGKRVSSASRHGVFVSRRGKVMRK